MGKTLAYIRAYTVMQNVKNQRHEFLEVGNCNEVHMDDFIEITLSPRHSSRKRRIEELQVRLKPGDSLLVTELCRLGRSTRGGIILNNQLIAHGITTLVIKQNFHPGENLQDMTG